MGEEVEPKNPEGMTKAVIHGRRAYEDFAARKAQAGAILYGSCSPEVRTHLNQIRDPVRMWEILTEQMDPANTTVGRLTLFRQFSLLRPVSRQPISTYFSQLLNITNQLTSTPEAVPDMVLKNHIFTTLPEMFKISIKVLHSRADVTIRQIMSDLKECEPNEALATKPDAVSEALYSQQGRRGVLVMEVEEDEETTFADEADKVTSGPKSGAAGAAPILTTLTIVGRRTATTNGREVVIGRAETAMNAEKQDTSRRIVQSVKAEMEAEMVTEVDSTVKAMELVQEVESDSTVEASEKILD